MNNGPKALLIILCAALLLGVLVIAFNPAYRQALLAIARGKPAESPLWKSNLDYYPEITLPHQAPAELPVDAESETPS